MDSLQWLDGALADLDARGLRRTLAERQSPQRGNEIVIDGRRLVNFGSNDYLGLAADERLAAAARGAIEKYGWGSGASPLITGRSELHAELERKLAEFVGTEAALVFPSGYAANVGTITALAGKDDAIFSDELNHASIIDGCRLSGAAVNIYRRPEPMNDLERLLKQGSKFRRRLIVTDSLFSMHGSPALLIQLAKLTADYDCMLLVDEAHATGVLGENGRGLVELLGAEQGVHVHVGTLSKALGSQGGFVAGQRRLIDWLSNRARPYFFSTAGPAASTAAALAALEIIRLEPDRRQRLRELSILLHDRLVKQEFPVVGGFQIQAVILKEPERVVAAAGALRERGFFVPGIRPPSVPEGESLLRISLTCLHTEEQIERLVEALAVVAK